MTAIASTPKGHNVKPPPGPAEPPARSTPSELTDEQRGWLSEASRSDVNGWLHVTIKGSPAVRGFQYGFLVADEYAESIRVYREMTYQDIGMGYDSLWSGPPNSTPTRSPTSCARRWKAWPRV